jgi:site-specific DNA recombinase
MKGKKVKVLEEQQNVYKNFMPVIVDKKDFMIVQQIFDKRVENGVKAKNQRIHRYAGILKCADCGKGFVARKRISASEGKTITYVCATFHKFGSKYCGGHRIMEKDMDEIVCTELENLINAGNLKLDNIDRNIQERLDKKEITTR